MKKILFSVLLAASAIIYSCGNSADEAAEKQRISDSISKAEAEALEQEALVAQKMLDSTEAINDTTK